MSDPGSTANDRFSASGSQPAPGFFPCSARLTPVSGQIRNVSMSAGPIGSMPNTSCGGCLNVIAISVVGTGRHFPARIRIGTPDQRHPLALTGPALRFGQHGREHLEHMVLEHVPDGAGSVVEPAAVRDVELLRHRDLDVV